jgi:hypothetical protein
MESGNFTLPDTVGCHNALAQDKLKQKENKK